MLHYVLDNNALQELVSGIQRDKVLSRIQHLFTKRVLCTHVTIFPLIEQVSGMTAQSFSNISLILNRFALLSNYGILPEPILYLKSSLSRNFAQKAIDDAATWRKILKEVSKCYDYTEFRIKFGDFQNYLNENLDRVKYAAPFDDEILLSSLLQRYELNDLTTNMTEEQLIKTLPSLSYSLDVHRYYKKKITNGKTPRRSDFLDFEYIVYLISCDYLVTNDKAFRDLVNRCGNSELKGRAIGLQEFRECLYGRRAVHDKRAPKSTTMVFIPEQN